MENDDRPENKIEPPENTNQDRNAERRSFEENHSIKAKENEQARGDSIGDEKDIHPEKGDPMKVKPDSSNPEQYWASPITPSGEGSMDDPHIHDTLHFNKNGEVLDDSHTKVVADKIEYRFDYSGKNSVKTPEDKKKA